MLGTRNRCCFISILFRSPTFHVFATFLIPKVSGKSLNKFITSMELRPSCSSSSLPSRNLFLLSPFFYFLLSCTFEGPAIFAIEPHDILPLSIFAYNDCLGGLNGHNCVGCVTSVCFYVPIMKHIYSWVNARSADKKNMVSMIKSGLSPVLCPGGVQEVSLMKSENECVLYLNSRFGFIKLALQQGVPVIPCFCFGLRKTFRYWIPKGSFFTRIGRFVGVLPMIFFGVWNIPFSPGKPVDYTNLVGTPIVLPKIENPSDEDIRKYHALFIKEISSLYEDNKKDFDMGDVVLRIA